MCRGRANASVFGTPGVTRTRDLLLRSKEARSRRRFSPKPLAPNGPDLLPRHRPRACDGEYRGDRPELKGAEEPRWTTGSKRQYSLSECRAVGRSPRRRSWLISGIFRREHERAQGVVRTSAIGRGRISSAGILRKEGSDWGKMVGSAQGRKTGNDMSDRLARVIHEGGWWTARRCHHP